MTWVDNLGIYSLWVGLNVLSKRYLIEGIYHSPVQLNFIAMYAEV